MQHKYIKNIQLSIEIFHLDFLSSNESGRQLGGKWLRYFLMAMALILWMVFNIVAFESYQFSPYTLLFINLVMYIVLAVMASPNYFEESKPSRTDTTH